MNELEELGLTIASLFGKALIQHNEPPRTMVDVLDNTIALTSSPYVQVTLVAVIFGCYLVIRQEKKR